MEKTRNPATGSGRVSGIVKVLGGADDKDQNTPNLISIQVEHLRRRFFLSPAMALVTAELAFSTQGRFE
jgi:hypothetical protein